MTCMVDMIDLIELQYKYEKGVAIVKSLEWPSQWHKE